jgi:small subunit ribosomal protein S9
MPVKTKSDTPKKTKIVKRKIKSEPKIISKDKQIAQEIEKSPEENAFEITPLKFLLAIGKRKTAVAQVKLFPKGEGKLEINRKNLETYFPLPSLQKTVLQPLEMAGIKNIDFAIKVSGGGIRGQAEAIRLGISRALVKLNPELRPSFRAAGLLTRDARIKERKKYGLKRARRAPQWQKR